MKKLLYLGLYLIASLLFVNCSDDNPSSKAKKGRVGDSSYTAEAAMAVYDRDPERALLIIDSAEAVGNIGEDVAKMLRAKVLCQTFVNPQYDSARVLLEELMESKYVDKPANREMILDLLIIVSRELDDNVQYLRWSTEKVELCRQQNLETEALRTEAEMCLILAQMGEAEKALAKLSGLIATLDGQRHFDEMDACVIALKRKISALFFLERPADVVPLARHMMGKVDDYGAHYVEYADDSYRMPTDSVEVADYCDFYRSQAYGFLARAYAGLGQLDSARFYLGLFGQSFYGRSGSGREYIAPVLGLLGDYGAMLAIYDEVESGMGGDTLNRQYATILRCRAQAADAAGNYRAASGYWKRYIGLNKLLNKRLLETRAYEYAARYHMQEGQMEGERLKVKGERIRNIAIGASIFALLVLLSCVWLACSRLAINRKNKVLGEQLAEAVKEKEERPEVKGEPDDAVQENLSPGTSHPSPQEMSESELFEYIAGAIRKEKLYLDPTFGRQTLIDKLNINKNRIGAAFTQGSGYSSLSNFVRELRLEYACRLLVERPDMTINDVAAASGFSNLTVFGRDFKAKYEVTPKLYRTNNTFAGL